MNNKEKLQIEIDLLLSLDHVIAYTGELDNIQVKSYIYYGDILKLLNEKRNLLNKQQ